MKHYQKMDLLKALPKAGTASSLWLSTLLLLLTTTVGLAQDEGNCQDYQSTIVVDISEFGRPLIESQLSIPNSQLINTFTLSLDIQHAHLGDLSASLVTPGGEEFLLFDRPVQPMLDFGCRENNIQIELSDTAARSASELENQCELADTGEGPGPPYAISGEFRPLTSFAGLFNQNAQGTWSLRIKDHASVDGGKLRAWTLHFCANNSDELPQIITNETLPVARGDEATITTSYLLAEEGGSNSNELTYTITSLPTEGLLQRSGQRLFLGNTFTQADINTGQVRYIHSGGIVLDDSFNFSLTDRDGETISGNIFRTRIQLAPLRPTLELLNALQCAGDEDASIKVIVSGGLPPYDYALNGGNYQDENTFSGLAAGTYTVRVLDQLGAEVDSPTLTISTPAVLVLNARVRANDLTLTANGGTPPYEYRINGSPWTPNGEFLDLANGSVVAEVRDANGCTNSTTVTIAFNNLTISVEETSSIRCNGREQGAITATATGGRPPYMYRLDNGPFLTQNTFFALGAGSYSMTVRDADGLEIMSSPITLSAPPPLTASAGSVLQTITVSAVGGTPPYRYSLNGGASTQENSVFADLSNGVYTITILDANNCQTTTTATILVNTLELSVIIANDVSCSDTADGVLIANVSGGRPPYQFQLNNGPLQTIDTFYNLSPGSYQISVRDADNFTLASEDIVLVNPPTLSISTIVTERRIDITAIGGTPPYRYSLQNNQSSQTTPFFDDLLNGTYTVSVLDDNGCLASTNAQIAVNTLQTEAFLTQQISCFGVQDASLAIVVSGGTPPFSYQLNSTPFQTDSLFSDLAPGSYVITVRDTEGFTSITEIITIDEPSPLEGNLNINADTITILAAGGTPPYRYSLNGDTDSQNSNVFFDLENGPYMVYILDANDCSLQLPATIAVNTMSAAIVLLNDVRCRDRTDASITVRVSGGTAPYQFQVNGGPYQSDSIFINLSPGEYTVSVRDAEGFVTTTQSVNITNPPLLTVSATVEDNSITLLPEGGTPPYLYSLDGTFYQESALFIDLEDGIYDLYIQDGNGCLSNVEAIVSIHPLVMEAVVIQPLACYGDSNAMTAVIPSGGIGPYTYQLAGQEPQTDSIFTNLSAGDYRINIEDIVNNRYTLTIAIEEPSILSLTAQTSNDSIIIQASGGTPPYRYQLNNEPWQTEAYFADLPNGEYSLTVADANNCTRDTTIAILVDAKYIPTLRHQLQLAPNPSKDGQVWLYLHHWERPGKIEVTVYAANGQMMNEFQITQATVNLPLQLAHLPAGVYSIRVSDGKQWGIGRIVIL